MSYTQADIAAAEAKIKSHVPGAQLHRTNYDWSLYVRRADKRESFVVYHCSLGGNGPTVIGDIDRIIAALKGPWVDDAQNEQVFNGS